MMGRWLGGARLVGRLREHRGLLVVLLAALLLRLALAPWFSFFGDQNAYIYWGSGLHAHFFDLYSALAQTHNPRLAPQYPPPAMYLFGVCAGFYHLLASHLGLAPLSYTSPSRALIAVMKLPAILCDLATVALLYLLGRRTVPAGWALAAAVSYAFAPAVVLDSAMWGQTDAVMLLPLLLALVCATQGQAGRAGVLFALCVLFKPQAVIFAPLLLVYLWRWKGWAQARRAVIASALTGFALCAPYLLPPHPQLLVFSQHVFASAGFSLVASPTAFNIWVALLIPNHAYQGAILGPFSPYLIGLVLFSGCLALALWAIWRDGAAGRLYECAGFVALAFFAVMTLQLERYLFAAPALFLVAALYRRRHALIAYLVSSVTLFLNMLSRVMAYDALRLRIGPLDSAHWVTAFHSWNGLFALVVALVNVALLLNMAIALYPRRAGRLPAPAEPAQRQADAANARAPTTPPGLTPPFSVFARRLARHRRDA